MSRPLRNYFLLVVSILCGTVNAATVQTFQGGTGQTSYALTQYGAVPQAAIVNGTLLMANTYGQNNVIAFNQTDAGLYKRIVAEWDFSIVSGADGFGFALLKDTTYGTSGAGPAISEEPSLAGSFAVGFDIYCPDDYQGLGSHEISLHWDGVERANKWSSIDYRTGSFNHVRVEADFVAGGAEVTVTVAGTIVYDKYFLAGMTPYSCRAAFGARTGGYMTTLYLDNVSVVYETPTTEPAPPLSLRTFNQQLMNGSYRTVQQTFSFPAPGTVYERVILKLTIAAPADDWDPWDRMMGIYIWDAAKSTRYEIARFMTPYSKAGTWWIDVTDYQGLLAGSRQMEMWLDSWVSPTGYLITTDFDFYTGDPQYRVLGVQNLWVETPTYGTLTDPAMSTFFTDKNVSIPSGADKVKLRFMVTGHGQSPNSENAAEFLTRGRTVTVNSNTYYNVLWRNDCYLNPCRNQSGTWQYSRAGWAPGDRVWPWDIDITSNIVAGQTAAIDYSADAYYNYTPDSGNTARHWVESQIIFYDLYAYPIIPYLGINGGGLQQTANANLQIGDSIIFSPQASIGGSWNWSGPNGFIAGTREITIGNIQSSQAGTYRVTYTNSYGTESSQDYSITATYWTTLLNNGFEAGTTFPINGWTASLGAKWSINSIEGNPLKYARGGGSSTTKENLVSGSISRNTGYVIAGDEMFNLTFDVKRMTSFDFDGSILASLYYFNDANEVVLGKVEVMEDEFADMVWHSEAGTLYVEATDASIGKELYVRIEGGPNSWNGSSAQRLGIDNIFIQKAALCDMADISDDAQVNVEDLVIFCQAWLNTSPDAAADIWPDSIVDMKDFQIISKCWNE